MTKPATTDFNEIAHAIQEAVGPGDPEPTDEERWEHRRLLDELAERRRLFAQQQRSRERRELLGRLFGNAQDDDHAYSNDPY